MPETVDCRAVDPTAEAVDEVATLFELYRVHYGQVPDWSRTLAWLGEMTTSGELRLFGAFRASTMVGFAATHQVPASLRLGRFWQLRDLFVTPTVRRQGIARRLIETVQRAASDAGAERLSLQTEPDNAVALALYRQCGFSPTDNLTTMSLDIAK